MTLHSGIDTVGVVSFGSYTETYGSTEDGNVAKLHASRGLIENVNVGDVEVDTSAQIGLLLKVY